MPPPEAYGANILTSIAASPAKLSAQRTYEIHPMMYPPTLSSDNPNSLGQLSHWNKK